MKFKNKLLTQKKSPSPENLKLEFLTHTYKEQLQFSVHPIDRTSRVPRLQHNILKVSEVYVSLKLYISSALKFSLAKHTLA